MTSINQITNQTRFQTLSSTIETIKPIMVDNDPKILVLPKNTRFVKRIRQATKYL